jgi:hypothetical protein
MQHRQHPRVRLRLAARLRWSAPFGQQTEQCETINVSRGGLLLACDELHGAGLPLWVTFPFDPGASGAEPETLARVVRCNQAADENHRHWNVAVHFEGTAHARARRNGSSGLQEKPNGTGHRIALPIRVRPESVPWHEEAMTIEVDRDKIKFLTNREYALGDQLRVSFVSGSGAPRDDHEEWDTRVTGIEMEAGSDAVRVTVRRRPR